MPRKEKAIQKLRKFLPNKGENFSDDKIPGKVIKMYRERNGLTQTKLAQRVGFGRDKPDTRRISRYESGGNMEEKTLFRFFVALNVEPSKANLLLESMNCPYMNNEKSQRLRQIQMFARQDSSYKITSENFIYLETGKIETKNGKIMPLNYMAIKYPENGWFRIRDIIFHCARLIGGDGSLVYKWQNGIRVEVDHEPYVDLPSEINESELLEKRRKEAVERGAPFKDRLKVRLKRWSPELNNEEKPKPLVLYVQPTSFFKRAVTNASLDELLPSGVSLRAKFAQRPDDFKESVLANALAINLMAITTEDRQVHYAIRGEKVADNPGGYAPCVSGTANWDEDKDSDGVFSPFKTARREAEEELSMEIGIKYEDIEFYGLGRIYRTFDPFLFGTIYIKGTSEDFIDLVRTNQDSYDVQQIKSCNIESITKTVNEIVKLIEYTQKQSTIQHATFSAAFGLYMNLIYAYPTKKTLINQLISGKISGQSHISSIF